MKLCDRCRVPGCLLDYGGKACKEARKKLCPDVVFTNADKIREMDDEALAVAIMCPHDDDKCPGPGDAKTCIKCCLGLAAGIGGGGEHGVDRDGAVCGADLLRVCQQEIL